jgi:plasmid stabilization system protein ParE
MADLARLRDFLSKKNEEAADKAQRSLASAFGRLKLTPLLGRALKGDLRVLTVSFGKYGYLLAYRCDGESVYILAVKSGREDRFRGL